MAGSRAASARESGQVREEAALSDTARAPRNNLAGADDRRARSRASFEEGCTVHFSATHARRDPRRLFRRFIERWNADDHDGMMVLVEEDIDVITSPRWNGQGGASGVALELAFGVLLQMDNGKIARMEFFEEPQHAFDALCR